MTSSYYSALQDVVTIALHEFNIRGIWQSPKMRDILFVRFHTRAWRCPKCLKDADPTSGILTASCYSTCTLKDVVTINIKMSWSLQSPTMPDVILEWSWKGSSIFDITDLRREGSMILWRQYTKKVYKQNVTMGGRVSKIVQNCVGTTCY